jgi:hypothetical protein
VRAFFAGFPAGLHDRSAILSDGVYLQYTPFAARLQ